MNLINWLRRPDRYWIWVEIGQNQYEGPIQKVSVMLFPEVVDEYVAYEIEEFTYDDYEMVKVKTDLGELTPSFLQKFIYTPEVGGNPMDQIISFQRYRGKKGDRYLTTSYLFEVKA
jgi:hypothetical protein